MFELDFSPEVKTVYRACLSNTEDLLRAAKSVLDEENLPNIACHLAVIALEEIGKAELLLFNFFAQTTEDKSFPKDRYFEDHIRKLFWALWGPSFGREVITRKQIEANQGLARQIHEIRLRGLYVSINEPTFQLPRKVIKEAYTRSLISLVGTRLEMAKLSRFRPLGKERKSDLSWFLSITKEEEERKIILGKASMNRLAELGNSYKWIKWLRQEFRKSEEEARKQAEMELKRLQPSDEESMQDKWKIKIRFYSNSHSIRANALNWWNRTSNWIKLYPVGTKKNELIAEFRLVKAVPVQGVWWAGWSVARRFITALNIGSMGFFWWYIPEQISRFYENIRDIEANMDLVVERSPRLKLDWKKDALLEQDLKNTALCFSMLPKADEKQKHEPFDNYLTGLAFLSKNDIHLQFEANAYDSFSKSLTSGMRTYGDLDAVKSLAEAFSSSLSKIVTKLEDREKHLKLIRQFEKIPPDTKGITLQEVGEIKLICDAYFILKFDALARERKMKESGSCEDTQ